MSKSTLKCVHNAISNKNINLLLINKLFNIAKVRSILF
jgi:hypothetical protein